MCAPPTLASLVGVCLDSENGRKEESLWGTCEGLANSASLVGDRFRNRCSFAEQARRGLELHSNIFVTLVLTRCPATVAVAASAMASSCADQKYALLECLADSPLVLNGRSVKECMTLTKEESGCKEFRTAYYECKRGQLDMRKRIKGNMPGTVDVRDKEQPAIRPES